MEGTARIDLHVHSSRSDGLYSPLQLFDLARRSGLAGLAITDHDTLPEVGAVGSMPGGVESIAGVEISVEHEGIRLHLLGYGFDPQGPALVEMCRNLQALRRERWRWLVDALRGQGVSLEPEYAERIANSGTPGSLHLARELVRMQKARGIRDAFERYLGPLDPEAPRARAELADAVHAIHLADGCAVLAHPPASWTREQWGSIVAGGVDGIEATFPGIKSRHRRFLEERGQEYGLVLTAGSDYHGDQPGRLGLHTTDRGTVDRLLARLAGTRGSP